MKKKKTETPREQKQPDMKKNELEEQHIRIDNLQKEKDELFAKLQRVSADYANLQKRTAKQIADTIGYEKEKLIKTLLPTLDNLEHTLQNAQSAETVGVLLKGIQIIYDQMLDIMKSHNVEQIKALGEPFDPAQHEAMMRKTEHGKEENIVLEEFQKGYKLNGRVIRPSKVIVNKLTQEQPAKQEAEPPEQTIDECQTTDTE
ncbi:MAG: nucleotide exchange factor GrpE [Planctomycetes bacterium]|nr:nucleotide exchange factor GrpE [Planctomycetota bacterium]